MTPPQEIHQGSPQTITKELNHASGLRRKGHEIQHDSTETDKRVFMTIKQIKTNS
jgi:hypothetical protein